MLHPCPVLDKMSKNIKIPCAHFLCSRFLVSQNMNNSAEHLSPSVHSDQWSAVSGKSPTKSDYGQAEEGAERRVERLDLCRGLEFS